MVSNSPLITVVIPVYNGAKTIAETITSVLEQSLRDFELLVINDGSTDNTIEVVQGFKDNRIRLLTYSNAGLAASRNRGIQQSCCDLISFIDADDLWTTTKLEDQLLALRRQSCASVAYSWTDCVNQSGIFFRRGSHISAEGNVYERLLMGNFIDSGSNALFRKSVFEAVGQFDTALKAAEDWDMFLRIAADHRFVSISEVQVLYRLSSQSMSANLYRQEQESLKVLNKAFACKPKLSWRSRRKSLAQLYRYLTYKALENCSTKEQASVAGRYLFQSVFQDPRQLRPLRLFGSQLSEIVKVLAD
ncbi:MAG: glycosyltransferase [Cyanobacteria bacterium J06648_16]